MKIFSWLEFLPEYYIIESYVLHKCKYDARVFKYYRKSHNNLKRFLGGLPDDYPSLDTLFYIDMAEINNIYNLPLVIDTLRSHLKDEQFAEVSTALGTDVLKFDLGFLTTRSGEDHNRLHLLFDTIKEEVLNLYKLAGKTLRILEPGNLAHLTNPYLFEKVCSKLAQREIQIFMIHPCFRTQHHINQGILKKIVSQMTAIQGPN